MKKTTYNYEKDFEGRELSTFRVEYRLWREVAPGKRREVRERIGDVERFLSCHGFKKTIAGTFSVEGIRDPEYNKLLPLGNGIYLWVCNGLINRARLRLVVEGKSLVRVEEKDFPDTGKLEDYLLGKINC
jgi:hypothetical protein